MRKWFLCVFASGALAFGTLAVSEGTPPQCQSGKSGEGKPGEGKTEDALTHPVCPIYSYAMFNADYCSYYSKDCSLGTYVSMSRDCVVPSPPPCTGATDPPCIDLAKLVKKPLAFLTSHASGDLRKKGIGKKLDIANPVPIGAKANQIDRAEGYLEYDSMKHKVPVVLHTIRTTPGGSLPTLVFGNGYEKKTAPAHPQFTLSWATITDGHGEKACSVPNGGVTFLIALNSVTVE